MYICLAIAHYVSLCYYEYKGCVNTNENKSRKVVSNVFSDM
jgi:hypothetical protein